MNPHSFGNPCISDRFFFFFFFLRSPKVISHLVDKTMILKPGMDWPVQPGTSHVSSPALPKDRCILKPAQNR
ncbi:hypothetical protein GYH30_009657 [Glycine max]|uniref:Uncharacterized protein n=1 Tax=Glycine max TaxID=3847 RepID=A0A0R0K7C7_SOYBN|nr:hypothetical protein GYH30_009657 [Glycine max]